MKALVTDGCGALNLQQLAMPQLTSPYDVLCENLFCSICVGTDLHIIEGGFHVPIQYPTVLGHESIARVVSVGDAVRSFQAGDLITRVGYPQTEKMSSNWGGFSEFGIARDHEAMRLDGLAKDQWNSYRVNLRVPKGLMPGAHATMIITWRETMSFVKRLGVGQGSRVLISGSGANGLSLGCMANLLGAQEVAMIGSPSRSGKALQAGMTRYVSYRDAQEVEAFCQEHAGNYDFLIDATGKTGSIDSLMRCLRANGTVTCYGRDDYANYTLKPFLVKGSFTVYAGGYDEYEAHDTIINLIRQGKLKAGIWLDQMFALDDFKEAFECVRSHKAVKAVIVMQKED